MKTPDQLLTNPAGRISKELFAYWWELFADRWPNQAPKLPALISLYLDKAREELTAGRFDRAAYTALCESAFFPTPRALIDYGYGDIEGEAADAWAEILRANAGGADPLTAEGTRARKMLGRQGGSQAVKAANAYTLEAMRSRFLRDWVADVRAEMGAEAKAAALPDGAAPAPALPEPAAALPEPVQAWTPAGYQRDAVTVAYEAEKARRAARTVEG